MNDNHIEVLEDRRLLSVNLTEAEPNDTTAGANVIQRVPGADTVVGGRVGAAGDRDWFTIQLQTGDVFGAALGGKRGLNPAIRLFDAGGSLLIGNDDSSGGASGVLPRDSPLPRATLPTDSEVYRVIGSAGTYFIEVSASADASTGPYSLDVVVARPVLEAEPVGTRQILFLDFDGARTNMSKYAEGAGGTTVLSPLSQSLAGWGLTAADEDAVIDVAIAKLTNTLATYVGANGSNGDFATTGIPGQFGIDIRNSRDHADEFGENRLMSRVIVGGLEAKISDDVPVGIAQYVDVGNFATDDDSLVNTNFIAGALAALPIQPPATVVDFVAHAIATIAAHEAGHIFGCFHTEQSPDDIFAGTASVMDPDSTVTAGPDLVFGTADDVALHFGMDGYDSLPGVNDTLNTVAFGLSTGKGTAPSPSASSLFGGAPAKSRHLGHLSTVVGPDAMPLHGQFMASRSDKLLTDRIAAQIY